MKLLAIRKMSPGMGILFEIYTAESLSIKIDIAEVLNIFAFFIYECSGMEQKCCKYKYIYLKIIAQLHCTCGFMGFN